MKKAKQEKLYCDVCKRCMTYKNASVIGVSISFDGEIVKKIYPEIKTKKTYLICYICWLRSLGIKIN